MLLAHFIHLKDKNKLKYINTFDWPLLSKSPLSQSEASIQVDFIHVIKSVSPCPPFLLQWGGGGCHCEGYPLNYYYSGSRM